MVDISRPTAGLTGLSVDVLPRTSGEKQVLHAIVGSYDGRLSGRSGLCRAGRAHDTGALSATPLSHRCLVSRAQFLERSLTGFWGRTAGVSPPLRAPAHQTMRSDGC